MQKAAYRFIDRLAVVLSATQRHIVCELEVVAGVKTPLELLLSDFKRELLDQQLRLQIKEETAPVRDLVLAYAFSRTGLQG